MKTRSQSAILLVALGILLFVGFYQLDQVSVQTSRNMQSLLNTVQKASIDKDWGRAMAAYVEAEQLWKQRQYLIMLNYAEAELSIFETTLDQLKGAIQGEDPGGAAGQALVAKTLWESLNNLIPKP